jgi:hypothetical protein
VAIYRIIEITNYSICSVLQLAMIRCNMVAVCCDVSRCAVERVPCAHEDVDVGTDRSAKTCVQFSRQELGVHADLRPFFNVACLPMTMLT